MNFDLLRLTGLQLDLGKAFQLGVRGVLALGLDVNLHALAARNRTLVCDVHRHIEAVGVRLIRADSSVLEAELRVGQAVAEGVKGFLLHVAVGAALHGVVGKLRQVAVAVVEGDGQFALRVRLTEQSAGHSLAATGTGIPGFENGVCVLICIVDSQCTAAQQNQNNRLAALNTGFQDFLLMARELQVRLVAAGELVALVALLTFKAGIQTEDCDNDIALLADALDLAHQLVGLGQAVDVVGVEVAALRVADFHIVAEVIFNALQHGGVAGGGALVVAQQRLAAVGIGADNADSVQLGLVQRQRTVVLQQRHDAVGDFQVQGLHLGAVDNVVANLIIRNLILGVKHTQTHAGHIQAGQALVDLLFGKLALGDGLLKVNVKVAAVQVAAVVDGQCDGLYRAVRDHVAGMEVLDGPAVGGNVAVKMPLVTQDIL